jgi:hypothetical protein
LGIVENIMDVHKGFELLVAAGIKIFHKVKIESEGIVLSLIKRLRVPVNIMPLEQCLERFFIVVLEAKVVGPLGNVL